MKNEPIAKKYFRFVLRRYRLDSGLTQNELSEKIGISRSYYSLFEAGKRWPNVDTLIYIAEALEIEPGEMLNSLVQEAKNSLNS